MFSKFIEESVNPTFSNENERLKLPLMLLFEMAIKEVKIQEQLVKELEQAGYEISGGFVRRVG